MRAALSFRCLVEIPAKHVKKSGQWWQFLVVDGLTGGLGSCATVAHIATVKQVSYYLLVLKAALKRLPAVRRILESRAMSAPFPSWEEAAKNGGSYEDEMVTRFRVEREAGRPRMAVQPLLRNAILELPQECTTIVDFGGGAGDVARDIVAEFPGMSVTVVETPAMVEFARRSDGVSFSCDIPPSDLFFTNAAIQYTQNPLAIIEQAFARTRRTLAMVRNSFSSRRMYQVQRSALFANGGGPIPIGYSDRVVSYPHQTINEDDVRQLASKNDFHCVFESAEDHGAVSYRDLIYSKQLVFRRSPSCTRRSGQPADSPN